MLTLSRDHTIQHVKAQCDSSDGYTCKPEISRFWGQNTPYYAVPSEISPEVPAQCTLTFAQMLSRHGARDPSAKKDQKYRDLITRIHNTATDYKGDFAFIKDYTYDLGIAQLTDFGRNQMVSSGTKFYNRYESLSKATTPFIRASGQTRVIESGELWAKGFHNARLQDPNSQIDERSPLNIFILSEEPGQNNTLNHANCPKFEDSAYIRRAAQRTWHSTFLSPITARLNENLPGVEFIDQDTIFLLDMCPFHTVANEAGNISPFCSLFTPTEWQHYDYWESLGKYYGYSHGHPLGPTQGVGFVNELIARLTDSPVVDHTTTNATLDSSDVSFPLGAKLYADFTHDGDFTSIVSAMGLFNSSVPLLTPKTFMRTNDTKGFSASQVTPFAGRAYVEKMMCEGDAEEMVRVVINDRVVPLETCGDDALGRCTLSAFVDSLTFAKSGGKWNSCYY